MFKNKTAWFSNSVRKDIPRFWVSQGGVISSWKTADYLFSDDAYCPETKRIHVSDAYAMDRATVFHSSYLSTCRLRQSTKSVPLGHYMLPPASVQREVRAMMGRFIWEQDELEEVTIHGNRNTEQTVNAHPEDGRSLKEKGKISQEDCMNTSPSRDEPVCCDVQFYPVNNMVSGYTHIDQLEKYSGELHDFLPSHTGYSVSRTHSRRHRYQHKLGQF
ncbi:telomere repeats-binding bouquet formation protein 2 [Colossoma macropomum]|uniref:telomere repeats-binding bouquet formation protein 2 n=1 Tax=Colossoma macropomum TaxID=42526 RepID=UPI0018655FE7|nr:telomere repeats-binding bouquet formation protein 2 [Colossoma macropomum]